ncbi:MAG: rRNA maturation RNase YbeY [Holosporaceae bacterium]|jgi:probable rRNA maturation factor|nr:rRNA maturation RNase YbeY [Holosporaceae bacterium]
MNLEVSLECDLWNGKEVKTISEKCASEVFREIGICSDNVEICFLFTNDEEIRILNKTYRGKNKSTNVLSFPADSINEKSEMCLLGSIALSFETIRKESRIQKETFSNHLSHLIIHGILHLLRYDHIKKEQAEEMEKLEIKILKKMNIANPYKEN